LPQFLETYTSMKSGMTVPSQRLSRDILAFIRDAKTDVLFNHSGRVCRFSALVAIRNDSPGADRGLLTAAPAIRYLVAIALAVAFVFTSAVPLRAADWTVSELTAARTKATAGAKTLLARREAFARLMASLPLVTGVATRQASVGGVPGVWVRPRGPTGPGRVILYLHGGGYYSGSSATHRNLAAFLSLKSGAAVFVPDYRLAPEFKFPAPVEDAERVYDALVAGHASSCAVAVAGESAGGGLVLSLVGRLKATGEPLPGALYVMSPMLDYDAQSPSMVAKAATDPVVKPSGIHAIAEAYLGGAAARPPGSEPLKQDYHNFPPTFVQVGTDETLLDDALRLVDAEAEAGVEVHLHVTRGVIHQWQAFPTVFAPARTALAEAAAFVDAHLCSRSGFIR
jgi:acetyl esterase/lipase